MKNKINCKQISLLLLLFFLTIFRTEAQQFKELAPLNNTNNNRLFITPIIGVGLGGYVYKTSSINARAGQVADLVLSYDLALIAKFDFGFMFMVDTGLLPEGKKLLFGYGTEKEWFSEPSFLGELSDEEIRIKSSIRKHFLRGEFLLSENKNAFGFFLEGGLLDIDNDFENNYRDKFYLGGGFLTFFKLTKFNQLFLQFKLDYSHYKSDISFASEIVNSTNNVLTAEFGLGLRFGFLKKK